MQLCTVRMLRNARKHLSKQDYRIFRCDWQGVRSAWDPELGARRFEALCKRLEARYGTWVGYLRRHRRQLLAFLGHHQHRRGGQRTARGPAPQRGGWFQSKRSLEWKLALEESGPQSVRRTARPAGTLPPALRARRGRLIRHRPGGPARQALARDLSQRAARALWAPCLLARRLPAPDLPRSPSRPGGRSSAVGFTMAGAASVLPRWERHAPEPELESCFSKCGHRLAWLSCVPAHTAVPVAEPQVRCQSFRQRQETYRIFLTSIGMHRAEESYGSTTATTPCPAGHGVALLCLIRGPPTYGEPTSPGRVCQRV